MTRHFQIVGFVIGAIESQDSAGLVHEEVGSELGAVLRIDLKDLYSIVW